MRTLRQSADLLSATNTHEGKLALAATLGFDAPAQAVDVQSADRLGVSPSFLNVHIIRGPGALRALLFDASADVSLKAAFLRLAHSLDANTSHVLWLLIGTADGARETGVACWHNHGRGARTYALVTQREHVVASDAEAISALAASAAGDDLLMHTRWCELLGREALSRRFYRVLEQRVHALGDSLTGIRASDRNDLALLCISRLVFLCFLEAKGWLNADRAFLANHFDACMTSGGRFHQRVLLPLFFGTLNTPPRRRAAAAREFGEVPFLNGGLFAKSALERRHSRARFSDDAFGALFADLLGAFRFTAREEETHWAEAAVDPEMLGRAFESLMAARERQTSGAFYTPHELVVRLSERALVASLADTELPDAIVEQALSCESLLADRAEALRIKLRTLTILDPACGSGAFLVHMLERLADLHRAAGDARPVSTIRRDVLARSIHGVDINPTAVWLCELRLWLSVVIENDELRMSRVPPLPNLDWNVRVGDALAGDAFLGTPSIVGPSAALQRLRDRYARAVGPGKTPLRAALAREERKRALAAVDRELSTVTAARRERLANRRNANLFGERTGVGAELTTQMRAERLRAAALRRERERLVNGGALPFSFPSHFGLAHMRGGFGIVIGNPPWVRLHNIAAEARAALRQKYRVYREAAWEHGSASGNASRGFASQVDLSSLFLERSAGLTASDGVLALLLPSKLWRSLAGGGARQLLSSVLHVHHIEDCSEGPAAFDAAVYPSLLVAARASAGTVSVGVRRRTTNFQWMSSAADIQLIRGDGASPILFLPPEARKAFDLLATRGTPLAESPLGRATLGVKSGCNDAFLVEAVSETSAGVGVVARGREAVIEHHVVRPLLRGDAVTPWVIPPSRDAIVWTHDTRGAPLAVLPGGVSRWLHPWRRQLLNRSDLHGSKSWWMLFRTESAESRGTRVVWSDFGKSPRAALLRAGDPTVPLNTCYVVRCDDPVDALALMALLNSPVAAAWLNAIAEPARGGWHRYLAWTVSLLPLPANWARARDCLAPLAERAMLGKPPSQDELLEAACRAYRVRTEAVLPLVAWCLPPKND